MNRKTPKVSSFHQQSLLALAGMAFLVFVPVFAQPLQQVKPETGSGDAVVARLVVVHTGDDVGNAGLATVKSCVRQSTAVSEQKALDGLHSVLMVMKYSDAGKIVGVHYGTKDICDFVRQPPSKNAS